MNQTAHSTGSAFVTGVGISFLILGVATVALTGIQLLLVLIFVDQQAVTAGMQAQHNVENLPEQVRFLLSNLTAISAGLFASSVLLTAASVGLIRRRQWARWVMVAFMIVGIVGHVAPLFLSTDLMAWTAELMGAAPGDIREQAGGFISAAWWSYAVFAVGFSILFGWIAWKLTTPAVGAEFRYRDTSTRGS